MNIDGKKIRKVIISTIIIVFFVFFKINTVHANECTTAKIKELKKEANKINFVYNLDEEYNPYGVYTYSVNFVNFSEKFYIVDSVGKKYTYTPDITADSTFGNYSPGKVISFKIYGAYGTECQDKLIRSAKISLPYYNYYSTYEECKGIEEYKLCKRNYNGKIESEEWFLKKVQEYKDSLIEKPQEPEKEKSFTEKVIEFFENNVILIILIVLAAITAIVILIIKYIKNKKNIKVNLDLKNLEGKELEEKEVKE